MKNLEKIIEPTIYFVVEDIIISSMGHIALNDISSDTWHMIWPIVDTEVDSFVDFAVNSTQEEFYKNLKDIS